MHRAGIAPAIRRLLLLAVLAVPSLAAHAIVVPMDGLNITKNTQSFTDTFSDGTPPPSGPFGPSTYAIQGSFTGAEFDSRLHFDSSRGIPIANATGQIRLNNAIIARTSTTDPATGLWVTDNITMTGRFDLVTPTGPLFNGYGLQLVDSPPGGTSSQLVQLYVFYNPLTGNAEIGFINQDFVNDVILAIDGAPLAPPTGADQIQLRLARVLNQAGGLTNQFQGSYAFLANGEIIESVAFDEFGTMFDGEDFVRARVFVAEAVVPEPSTYALMLAGLAALGWVARRRAS